MSLLTKANFLSSLLFAPTNVDAISSYKSRLPNGTAKSTAWGHLAPGGGGARNVFGLAFVAAGKQWTPALCNADSDGDGITNGQEMGDPDCVWTVGAVPSCTENVSHPGDPAEAIACGVKVTTAAPVVKTVTNDEGETVQVTVTAAPVTRSPALIEAIAMAEAAKKVAEEEAKDYKNIRQAHATLMTIAWLFLAPMLVCLMVVRRLLYWKERNLTEIIEGVSVGSGNGGLTLSAEELTSKQAQLAKVKETIAVWSDKLSLAHRAGMPLVLLLTAIGGILILFMQPGETAAALRRSESEKDPNDNGHPFIGLTVLLLMVLQPITYQLLMKENASGPHKDLQPGTEGQVKPPLAPKTFRSAHRFFGTFILITAFIACKTGWATFIRGYGDDSHGIKSGDDLACATAVLYGVFWVLVGGVGMWIMAGKGGRGVRSVLMGLGFGVFVQKPAEDFPVLGETWGTEVQGQ